MDNDNHTKWLLAEAEEGVSLRTAETSAEPDSPDCITYIQWLRLKVKALKQESVAIFYALQDSRTPWYSKILPLLALSYYLCPLDLIPDFIPLLGSVDDLLIVPSLLWLSLSLIPTDIMGDARKRAIAEPLSMAKNWCAAMVIFTLWIAAVEASIYMTARYALWSHPDVRHWLPAVMLSVLVSMLSMFAIWAGYSVRLERQVARAVQLSCPKSSVKVDITIPTAPKVER